jgi:Holliday junction resolvasome RuvABC endonuclease subunit
LLKLPDTAFKDASDALAVAVCHYHSHRLQKKVSTA